MDQTFSDPNYSKVCKFCTYTTSHSFFNYFFLTFEICTVLWLNCTNLKDELNRSYNGGGVVYVLKVRHLDQHDSTKIRHFCVTRFFIEFLKFAEGGGIYLFKIYIYKNTLHDIFILTYPWNMDNNSNPNVIWVLIVRSHLENIIFQGFLIPGRKSARHVGFNVY